jgi:signal transduction histidine kinase
VEQLQLVASESESMGRLVNDLLEIARDDAGQLQLACRPIDPYAVLQALLSRLQPAIDGRLQLQPAADGCGQVRADPERLSQCLTNLIENALKYSPPGSAIQLGLSSEGDQVVFHIRDQGAGVPEPDRERIFERFKRGSTSGSTSGHGIGLAVVKTLMDRMGGTVLVADAPGGGADFQLWLPAVPSPPLEPRRPRRWFSPG